MDTNGTNIIFINGLRKFIVWKFIIRIGTPTINEIKDIMNVFFM